MHKSTEHERVLRDSGLFTQVQPEWLAESAGEVSYVSSKGVLVFVDRKAPDARLFFDTGVGETFYSSGWYTPEELRDWLLPVMRSPRAWARHLENTRDGNGDLTLALELV